MTCHSSCLWVWDGPGGGGLISNSTALYRWGARGTSSCWSPPLCFLDSYLFFAEIGFKGQHFRIFESHYWHYILSSYSFVCRFAPFYKHNPVLIGPCRVLMPCSVLALADVVTIEPIKISAIPPDTRWGANVDNGDKWPVLIHWVSLGNFTSNAFSLE